MSLELRFGRSSLVLSHLSNKNRPLSIMDITFAFIIFSLFLFVAGYILGYHSDK